MKNLDQGLETLFEIARGHGISKTQLRKERNPETELCLWEIDYEESLEKQTSECLENLTHAFDLLAKAWKKNDAPAVSVGLSEVCTASLTASNLFSAIYADSLRMLKLDPRFNWPELPTNYEISNEYNYKGPR